MPLRLLNSARKNLMKNKTKSFKMGWEKLIFTAMIEK